MVEIGDIKAIAFDADGTLLDFDKVMRHSLGRTLKEMERHHVGASARMDIERMIEIRDMVAEESSSRIVNLEAIRRESFRRILDEIGRPDDPLASRLHKLYMKHRYEDIEIFDDAVPVLNKLKGKYTLGLLSNGNSYPERCGLGGIFDFIVFPRDYGVKKPDPEFYHIAVEKAGCLKEQFLNVGDSLQNDVITTTAIGIKSVWLNRNREIRPPDTDIEYEIQSLYELPGLLQDNNKNPQGRRE